MRTRSFGLAAALVAAVALGAVASNGAPSSDHSSVAGSVTSVSYPRGLEAYRAADIAFFSEFQYPEAAEAEVYTTLGDALTSATVVIVGQVVDVGVSRVVGPAEDALPYVGMSVKPLDVLHGTLPAEHQDSVTVEFVGVPANLKQLQSSLPGGYAVWVLRNKAELPVGVTPKAPPTIDESDYYRLVSSQALFVQGEQHVVNPLEHVHGPEIPLPGEAHTELHRDPVIVEVETFRTLSALAEYTRAL